MRRLSSFCCLFLLLAAWRSASVQRSRRRLAADDHVPLRADTRLVVLPVSVSDKNGKLVTDLQQKAFKVFENGVEQPIKIFRREDVPVSLGIIIDNSGSMREKRQKVETASLDLVKASNPQDEVFIVNFNDEAYLDVPFTNDIKKMEEGVARIDSRGGTAMRDAISMSIDYLKEEGQEPQEGAAGGHRRQRQRQHHQPGAAGEPRAAKRSADLLHRAAERRRAARGQDRQARAGCH